MKVIGLAFGVMALPALAVWLGTNRRLDPWSSLAVAITAIFAVLALHGAISLKVWLPFSAWILVGEILLLSMVLLWVARRHAWRSAQTQLPVVRPAAIALVTTTIVVSVWTWWSSTAQFQIPNHDAQFHAVFVRNIARFGTLSTPEAYSNFLVGTGSANIYPLGFHAFAAAIHEITGTVPSATVYLLTCLFVTVLWPISVFVFARCFVQGSSAAAAVAAIVTVGLHQFPLGALGWGGVPTVVGITVMLFAAAAVRSTLAVSLSAGWTVFVLGMVGLSLVHTSEMFLLAAFSAAASWPVLSSSRFPIMARTVAISAIILSFAYPFLERALGASLISSLATVSPNSLEAVYPAVGLLIMLHTGTSLASIWPLVLLLVALCGLMVGKSEPRSFLLYSYCFFLALVASQATQPGWSQVSHALAPWYRQYQRMSYFLVPALAVMVAVGVESLWIRGEKSWNQRGLVSVLLTRALAVGLIVVFIADARPIAARYQKDLFSPLAVLSKEVLEAPAKVAEFRQIEGNVLASFDSGLGYWEIDHDVPVLSAPFLDAERVALRETLNDAILDLAGRPDVQAAVEKLKVTHVGTNDRSMSGAPRPSSSDIRLSNNFDEVWTADGVTLWKMRSFASSIDREKSFWTTTEKGEPVRWITAGQSSISVRNNSNVTGTVRMRVVIAPTPCPSPAFVTLGSETVKVGQRKGPKVLNQIVTLEPKTSVVLALEVNGPPCSVEGVSPTVFTGISSVSVDPT